jgi:hypothetical protein
MTEVRSAGPLTGLFSLSWLWIYGSSAFAIVTAAFVRDFGEVAAAAVLLDVSSLNGVRGFCRILF